MDAGRELKVWAVKLSRLADMAKSGGFFICSDEQRTKRIGQRARWNIRNNTEGGIKMEKIKD